MPWERDKSFREHRSTSTCFQRIHTPCMVEVGWPHIPPIRRRANQNRRTTHDTGDQKMSGPIPKTNVNRESRYHYQVNTIKSRNLKSRNEEPEKKDTTMSVLKRRRRMKRSGMESLRGKYVNHSLTGALYILAIPHRPLIPQKCIMFEREKGEGRGAGIVLISR